MIDIQKVIYPLVMGGVGAIVVVSSVLVALPVVIAVLAVVVVVIFWDGSACGDDCCVQNNFDLGARKAGSCIRSAVWKCGETVSVNTGHVIGGVAVRISAGRNNDNPALDQEADR